MPVSIPLLRRWFVIAAVLIVLLVAGAYFYARSRVRNALTEVPGKIGVNVQQTANGFTVSRSLQGRTIFKVQASKAIQFKKGGVTELHDVTITLYGRDSSRFDQIYGSDFQYDPNTGDVSANGEVQIDLEANPEGLEKPDQALPKELKNPIHLKTSGLVFNQKTGNAHTDQKIEFSIPQASGSAMGANYVSKDNVLILGSQIQVDFHGQTSAAVRAAHGIISRDPRAVEFEHPAIDSGEKRSTADKATLFLRPDNTLDRIVAEGNLQVQSPGPNALQARADRGEFLMAQQRDTIRTAVFTGNVELRRSGADPVHASAGKVVTDFVGKNEVAKVHAEQDVRIAQQQKASSATAAQDVELRTEALDARLSNGHLVQAQTLRPNPQIAIRAPSSSIGQQTLVTADSFMANFDRSGQISAIQGVPNARVTTAPAGEPERITTSNRLDVKFRRGAGIESIVQQGGFVYYDGERKAWADSARYTPGDQMLVLTGSPRVVEAGMTTTARSMRLNRASGDAFADGDVKSTYSDLKAQPNGSLLAASDPIHVTAASMNAHRSPGVATYTGDARLWQNANIIEAPSIHFDRDHRSLVAQAADDHRVSTVLVQVDKSGKATPVAVKSGKLTYIDADRTAIFQGGVVAKGQDATITADQSEVFLAAHGRSTQPGVPSPGQLNKIVAEGNVVITQPNRRASGEKLEYTAAEEKFILSGGSPSIFDAEHGKITGVSLTFFRHDDRVLVEGSDKSPTVTQTRVAR